MKPKTFPIGRDSGTGQFIPVKEAQRDKQGAEVERIPVRQPSTPSKKK